MKIAMKRLPCTHCSLLLTAAHYFQDENSNPAKNTSTLFLIHWIKGRQKGTMEHIREIQEIVDVHQGAHLRSMFHRQHPCVSVNNCYQLCIGSSKTCHTT